MSRRNVIIIYKLNKLIHLFYRITNKNTLKFIQITKDNLNKY